MNLINEFIYFFAYNYIIHTFQLLFLNIKQLCKGYLCFLNNIYMLSLLFLIIKI